MAATVTIASGATWQEVAADRQKHRDATISALDPPLPEIKDVPLNTIPLAKQVLTAEEVKITEMTVEDLVVQLAKGAISCVTVMKAFLRRAGLTQKAVRSLAFSFSFFQLHQLINGLNRQTASPNSFQPGLSNALHTSIPTSKNTRSPSAPYTVSRSA
jgi:hypothetical protein